MTPKTSQNCGKCGLCLNVCPVYKILKEEHASPRAKLQLIKAYEKDTLSSSPLLKEIVSKCLMCGSCAANCPSGINHYSKFMEMRSKLAETQGEAPAVKSLIYLLAREYRIKLGAGLAKTGQKYFPKHLADTYKIGNIPVKNLPHLNPTPLRRAAEKIILPDKPERGTIVYFTGCATNYLYDDTGFAFIGILKHLGYKVVIPGDQTCCSIPLLFHGAADKAQKNINSNINALKGTAADAILVDCSTCGQALKSEYPKILEEMGRDPSEAMAIAEKVTDGLSFIDRHFDRLEFDSGFNDKAVATYHAPCHTKNTFQSHTIAEKLLSKLPFIDYKRAPDIEVCCGGGGTFFYEYPHVSKKMTDKKKDHARALNTDYWLTDCPVCRLNLSGSLDKSDHMKVCHPATLIYEALKQT